MPRARTHARFLGHALEHREIDRLRCRPQSGMLRALFETVDQRIDAGIIGCALPPIQLFERGEAMLLDRQHLFRRERPRPFLDQRAKGPIALMPPGAARDLRHFGDAQATLAVTVEFVEAGKGDMRHVHVETSSALNATIAERLGKRLIFLAPA